MAGSLPIGACCRACGYVLAGLGEARCPECGRAFDPADPRTFERSARARRWRRRRRPLILVVLALGLVYGLAPRGYVRGTLVYMPGGIEPQERYTQWRMAPPRWMARVPYPRWTISEKGGQYLTSPTQEELAGEVVKYVVENGGRTWLGSRRSSGSGSSYTKLADMTPERQRTLSRDYARRTLDAIVRRQCEGSGGIMLSPDDSELPQQLRQMSEPW